MANLPLLNRALRVVVFEDWGLKFVCLILATLLWFYIDGELTDQRNFVVSVRPADLTLPTGFDVALDRPMPRFIVRVRGPRRRLQLMSDSNLTYTFKRKVLENPQPGRNVLNISPSDLEIEGFDVLDVTPNDKEAAIELRETATRSKPVRVKPVGQPRAGYLIGMTRAVPSQVNIDGPVRDLDQIEYVNSEDVDVTDADQDVVRDVGIIQHVVIDGRRIDFRTNQKVRATVPIHAVEVTRRMTFDVRSMALEGLAMTVEPRSVEVEVVGEERDLSAPDVMSSIVLYVEWPNNWERPKDAGEILGPTPQQVKVIAPPRVQVHGVNGGALPTVDVRGALAGVLKRKE
jgi:YbbR domain-containing protein